MVRGGVFNPPPGPGPRDDAEGFKGTLNWTEMMLRGASKKIVQEISKRTAPFIMTEKVRKS